MSAINDFLIQNDIRIVDNPCISPDFCLDWDFLKSEIENGGVKNHSKSEVRLHDASLRLVEGSLGDCAWQWTAEKNGGVSDVLESGIERGGIWYFPATYNNLIHLKNLLQEADDESTVFPGTEANLSSSTLGIGARFTTLHWPGVFWAMKHLGMGFTANQNSIPRELVYDVDKMLEGNLDKVPFPFIGADVPEGHQGQSVQGMSHGAVIENLKTGFHKTKLPWSFNADHQPIGGKYDGREDALVEGCLFATYITFDLSPELSVTKVPESSEKRSAYVKRELGEPLLEEIGRKLSEVDYTIDAEQLEKLLCYVWPAMRKMKVRDRKYRQVREKAFSTEKGRYYLRELSIDELPGLTSPETTAVMLTLCELMDMSIQFVAPAFGFQKNMPYEDNLELESLIRRQWEVCRKFDVSIGFHSGSGKSAENYQVMGRVTHQNLEIKTSGRYTYEMGRALFDSENDQDQKLWSDWFDFTLDMAVAGAFSNQDTERKMARSFITQAYQTLAKEPPSRIYDCSESCRNELSSLRANPDLMFWFEYNFLYVLAAEGRADKSALGDHSPAGYKQRKRFYTISDEGRLRYSKHVASYLIFLAKNTGLVEADCCDRAKFQLDSISCYDDFLAGI